MANFDWQDGVNGDWATGADWGGTSPNGATADAVIAGAGTYGVTIGATESFTVDSVVLENPTATLLINGALDLGGTEQLLELQSGTLDVGGVINAGAGAVISIAGSLQNTGLINLGAGADLDLRAPEPAGLGSVAVSGGTINLTTGAALSNFAHVTFSDSGASTTLLDIGIGGSLDLGGALADLAGADVIEVGNGGTLADGTLNGALTSVELKSGAELVGITYIGVLTGPLTGALYANGLTVENSSGTGPGTIDLVNYGDVLDLLGSQTLGSVVINLGTSGGEGNELIDAGSNQGVVTLAGPMTITADGQGSALAGLAGYSFFSNAVIEVSGTGFQVESTQFINAGEIDTGVLASLVFNGRTLQNFGTVNAGSNAAVTITASLNNTGLIELGPDAVLDLGSADLVRLGSVSVQGGDINLFTGATFSQFSGVTMSDAQGVTTLFDIISGGSLDLGGAVFTISGADASEVDDGGVLSDGTIDEVSAPVVLAAGATLNNITYIGDLTAPAGELVITGGLTVENPSGSLGTININEFSGFLDIADAETLNNVVINIGVPSGYGFDQIEAGDASAPDTIGPAATINEDGTSIMFAELTGYALINAGLIDVTGANLTVEPIVFINDGQISASGGANLAFDAGYFENFGTVSALSGAQVVVGEAVTGTGTFIIDPATLTFDGAVAAGQIIRFDGGGVLELGDPGQFAGTITGLTLGDTIQLDGFNVSSETFVAGTGLVLNDGALTLSAQSTLQTADFEYSNNGGDGEVFVICYLKGTRIATPAGEVAIEDLAIGDAVVTRFGGVQRIRWIGRQSFGGRFLRRNRDAHPVRIAVGALGDGLPKRDLYVSGGHSMLLDGVLVLARNLVNGVSITQDWAPETVEYYQLEFRAHDCVLAEGAWSESYADCEGMRAKFHNAAEYAALYRPRRVPARPMLCAPRPECGPILEAAVRPVVARAAALRAPGRLEGWIDRVSADGLVEGWAWDAGNPALPVLLEVLLDGEVVSTVLACETRVDVARAGKGLGRCGFVVRAPGAKPGRVAVRRAGDGAALGMVEALRARVG